MEDIKPMSEKKGSTRFKVERSVLLWNSGAKWVITIGGVGVIGAVLLMCAFIFVQILPLFKGARVTPAASISVPPGNYVALATDEWTELPILIREDGTAIKIDLKNGGKVEPLDLGFTLGEGEKISAVQYSQKLQTVLLGTSTGRFIEAALNYSPEFVGDTRTIHVKVETGKAYAIGSMPGRIIDIGFGVTEGAKLVVAVKETPEGKRCLVATLLRMKRTMFSEGEFNPVATFDVSDKIMGSVDRVLVNTAGDMVLATTGDGGVYYFELQDEKLELMQNFRPFEDRPEHQIAQLSFILSDVSAVFNGVRGECRVYSLHVPEARSRRLFGETRRFVSMANAVDINVSSLRNKAFLLAGGRRASLRYMTTGKIRWEAELPFQIQLARISGKYNGLLFLGDDAKLHVMEMQDRFPEAGVATFFTRIWYEGYSKPTFSWQSTGGTDDFEPKLSMIPLIIGTLKGTLYAMLFAMPIAILAAMYTSQFQQGNFRRFVKPTMEIMASLPSVVLGYMGAFWLMPRVVDRIPTVLLFIALLPITAYVCGFLWWRLPMKWRRWLPEGREFMLLIPVVFLCWYGADALGPVLENRFCVVDLGNGKVVSDFRQWWLHVPFFGGNFRERNALVVGFVMGFAVIPIIFTISEDAMSNVPKGLITASTALGASRWQTVTRVVLPTASAGVFSATMMGLGRAVGETMIVVMAAGNTATMDWQNPFTGMRTLSANIAVELPEAPAGETLYRTLFLGAFLLFLITFAVNTLAELLRHHLRNKYKTV